VTPASPERGVMVTLVEVLVATGADAAIAGMFKMVAAAKVRNESNKDAAK
jgi:hypothetical protein